MNQIRKFVGFKLAADYYNGELCVWEPFVEPWQCRVGVHTPAMDYSASPSSSPPSSHTPNANQLMSLTPPSPSSIPSFSVDPQKKISAPDALEIIIHSRDPLNVNFSRPLVDTCTVLFSLFQVSLIFNYSFINLFNSPLIGILQPATDDPACFACPAHTPQRLRPNH